MFKEELSYDDRWPIHIRVASLKEYPLHYHMDIEFIFVLKGEIRLCLGSNDYLLKENSVFVCNGREVHSMYATDIENVVALIQVNNRIFSKYYPNLSRSCFRTFTDNPNDERLALLRAEITKLLLNYFEKPYYQEINVAIIKKLLSYLEANFNYFSVKNHVVLNEAIINFTMSKRISRIILSIFENYYKRLTLKDLSEKENLSTYYLSHIIHEYIGLSFRDFLCFARVEAVQMMVLDDKIDIKELYAIAGFSNQKYFEKHFEKWFGEKSSTYREKFIPKIKSDLKKEQLEPLERNHVLQLLKRYEISAKQAGNPVSHLDQNTINVSVDCIAGESIPFNPKVRISQNKDIKESVKISSKLENFQFNILLNCAPARIFGFFGLDTIAGAVYMLRSLTPESLTVPFMDTPTNGDILQGTNSIVFQNGIAKCSYYSLLFLTLSKGNLIDRGANYWIVKKAAQNGIPCFVIMIFNGNENTDAVCTSAYPKEKTVEAIATFNDELNIKFSLKGLLGPFTIATLNIDETTDYFYYLNRYGNQSASPDIEQFLAEQYTSPYSNIYNTDAIGSLEIHTRLDGLCVQMLTITPLQL